MPIELATLVGRLPAWLALLDGRFRYKFDLLGVTLSGDFCGGGSFRDGFTDGGGWPGPARGSANSLR